MKQRPEPFFPPPTFDPSVKTGTVKVIRPDPETGEVVTEGVSAERFKQKLPGQPTKDDPKLWDAYWEAHATRLTREERKKIADGRSAASLRPLEHKPAWQKGNVLAVASNLAVEVLKVGWTREGYVTHFAIKDYRCRYMKQVVGGGSVPRTDEHGYAIGATPAAVEAARIDGNYTTSPAQAVPDSGAVMDDAIHRRLHGETEIANATRASKQRVQLDKMRAEQRLLDARKKNQTSTVRYLERVIKHHDGKDAA